MPLQPCATFRLHRARGGGGTEHTALHPSRGKENVGQRRRNRGLVARRGTRGGRRRNGGGKGVAALNPTLNQTKAGALMRRVPLGLVGCLGRGRGETEGVAGGR